MPDLETPATDGPALEVSRLKREVRRLERELEYQTSLLKKTDELYRTSEKVLTKAHEDLEKVLERQRAMQAELNETSRMAAIGELAARIIHEVLNPMTSIMGRLERLLERDGRDPGMDPLALGKEILAGWAGQSPHPGWAADAEDLRAVLEVARQHREGVSDDLRFMHRTATHMVRLVNNMRSVGRQQVEVTRCDANTLAGDAVELMRDILRRHRVTVIERYEPHLPSVWADGSELIQILTNLLTNAQQAMPSGGRVEVSTHRGDGRVEIRVRDSGAGIPLPPEKVELIFESGFTTKSRQEGTGLGLAICRRFARRHGGEITVESTFPAGSPGHGTCFLVWFPALADGPQRGGSE